MSREVMQQALDALQGIEGYRADIDSAIAALSETLAQPEQEPDYNICPSCGGMASDPIVPNSERFPQPPQRQPLTREQLADAWISTAHITHATERQIAYGRAIEAAHGIGTKP